MKKQLLFLFILFATVVPNQIVFAQSPNFDWADKFGSGGSDIGVSIVVDNDGNVYSTGSFSGTVDFDPGSGIFNLTSNGSTDIFVNKLDSSGNLVWAKQMGGNTSFDVGMAIAIDDNGNVYTTGRFYGPADFDPGNGSFILNGVGFFDVFISKLDSMGNFIWAKELSGSGYDVGFAFCVDLSGNVFATGNFENTIDFDPGTGAFNMSSSGGKDPNKLFNDR